MAHIIVIGWIYLLPYKLRSLGFKLEKYMCILGSLKTRVMQVFLRYGSKVNDIGNINGYVLGKKITENIGSGNCNCIQPVKGLWRIYITNEQAKAELVKKGLNVDGKNIRVYPTNPLRTGTLAAIADGSDENI